MVGSGLGSSTGGAVSETSGCFSDGAGSVDSVLSFGAVDSVFFGGAVGCSDADGVSAVSFFSVVDVSVPELTEPEGALSGIVSAGAVVLSSLTSLSSMPDVTTGAEAEFSSLSVEVGCVVG